jgi:hypothetical protein
LVQHPKLDACEIGRATHDSAERVDLTNHRPLCNPTDGRVAGHLAYSLEVLGKQEGSRAATSSEHCSLAAGVASTNHNNIILFHCCR